MSTLIRHNLELLHQSLLSGKLPRNQFLKRETGDRPLVVPKGSTNFAFLGQYSELPDDVVFTVEYSVRSAQTAVFSLLGLDKKPTEMYHGSHELGVLVNAWKSMHQ
jgi:oleate hydratase